MTTRTVTYELRKGRLCVNGEPVGIDRRVMRAVLGESSWAAGRGLKRQPLSEVVARRILELDRAIGLIRLKAEIALAAAA